MTTEITASAEGSEPLHPLAHDISWLLGRAWLGFGEVRSDALSPFGITVREFAVLTALASSSGSQIEVANLTKIDKSTFAVAVDALEERRLIQRVPDAEDRRVKRLVVTDAARAMLPSASAAVETAEQELVARIDSHELQVALSVLRQLGLREFANYPAFSARRFQG